jgi:hypothetical protein
MTLFIVALLIDTAEYRCTRWIWWWDGQYQIAKCLEWKKVEKK